MYNPLNFSISDRVEAAKTSTTDKTHVDAIPGKVNPSPGSSTIAPPDTSGINTAGTDVAAKQTMAQDGTSKSKIRENRGDTSNLTYNKQTDPEYPTEIDPSKKEPKPKNKTFTERLLDNQMQSYLNKESAQPPSNTQTTEYPKDQGQDINKPQPVDNTPSRPKTGGFDPSAIKAPPTQQPSGKLLTSVPQERPGVDLGPKYTSPGAFKPQNIKIRPITPPKFK